MATLNLSSNGPSISKSYQSIVTAPPPSGPAAKSPTYGQWAVFSVTAPLVSAFQQDSGKESVLKVQSTGEGELVDLVDEFSDGRIQFGFVKVKDPNTSLPKCVLIAWCGEGVPERTKGYFTSHLAAVSKVFHGYHVQVTARSERDLTPEGIITKVADASGSKYSGGSASSLSSTGKPPPPVVSKPAFTPTRVGGGGGGTYQPLVSRSRVGPTKYEHVDEDGWGADAPPVTRTQLEKVESAYKPTKVNMGELASQKSEPARYNPPKSASNAEGGDVVKGTYQPIGKVDIAAIRRQARESGAVQDDRPTVVKGAYEPVGKVDIAAIRAKAQGPSERVGETEQGEIENSTKPAKSLSDRASAFTQPERLTSLPKPKVSGKLGSSSGNFISTKPPTTGGFQTKAAAPAPPVGMASRTFADEGGKTPAQVWAEKKARERGNSVTDNYITSPVQSQPSGEGGWKSSYSGKSWAPVQTTRTGPSPSASVVAQSTGQAEDDEVPRSPAGGVGAIREKFRDTQPMGGFKREQDASEPEPSDTPMPPPMNLASKPNAGAARGIPMPGLQMQSQQADQDEESERSQAVPPPPTQRRSPTPPTPPAVRPSSPIRVAMPVGRGAQSELEAPEERFSPPTLPVQSVSQAIDSHQDDLEPEPQVEADDPARGAATATAASTFGAATAPSTNVAGKRALIQYDYEKAEDNEIELREGEYVTNIEMVDEDWWMGQNSRGETGYFPSNYVELVEDDDNDAVPERHGTDVPTAAIDAQPEPVGAQPAAAEAGSGQIATAMYDYDAVEDNELSFPEGAKITGIEFPDDDWWYGEYEGKSGLFPANYVQLDQ